METVVSKAQEKRDRQARESLNHTLRNKLRYFENDYLNSSVQWEINEVKRSIANIQKEIDNFPTREITPRNRHQRIEDLQWRLQREKEVLTLDAKITLRTIVAAKKSYDNKVERLVTLLIQEGFSNGSYKVVDIHAIGSLLEFLITKSDKEVHARLIWVNCTEKTPHFRFITTTRRVEYLK
jgi:uncharacterized coiled-coil DUF342 family protein